MSDDEIGREETEKEGRMLHVLCLLRVGEDDEDEEKGGGIRFNILIIILSRCVWSTKWVLDAGCWHSGASGTRQLYGGHIF